MLRLLVVSVLVGDALQAQSGCSAWSQPGDSWGGPWTPRRTNAATSALAFAPLLRCTARPVGARSAMCTGAQICEGEVSFDPGACFYRPHSAVVRDLGVLAVRHLRRETGRAEPRVLDAMCGSGIRALRYLKEGGAGFVLANDANFDLVAAAQMNLGEDVAMGRVELRTGDASDCFLRARLSKDYFDLIDVDGFGSGAPYNAEAVGALKMGGLLYLCCTDARTAAGKNAGPQALRAFGAVAQSMPFSNELAARLVIADAVRQAATRGMLLQPFFSFYHRASSCTRVMLRLTATGRKSAQVEQVGFVVRCSTTGNHWPVPLEHVQDPRGAPGVPTQASHAGIRTAGMDAEAAGAALSLTGPVWPGRLGDPIALHAMAQDAAEREGMGDAQKLLAKMEEDLSLDSMGYLRLKEIGRFLGLRGVQSLPSKADLIGELRSRGAAAGEAQAEAQAIKTDASMEMVAEAAMHLLAQKPSV